MQDVYYNVLQHFVSGLPLYMKLESASNRTGLEASGIMKGLWVSVTIRFLVRSQSWIPVYVLIFLRGYLHLFLAKHPHSLQIYNFSVVMVYFGDSQWI